MVGFASDHGLSDAGSKTLDFIAGAIFGDVGDAPRIVLFRGRCNIWWSWRVPFVAGAAFHELFGSDHEIAARGFGDLIRPILATQFVSKSTIVCALAISQTLPLPRIVTLQLHQILSPCNITLLGPSLLYSTLYSTLLFCSLFLSTQLYSSSLCSIILYSTLLHSTIQSTVLQYSTLFLSLYSTLLYPILLYSALPYSILLYSILLYSILLFCPYSSLLLSTLLFSISFLNLRDSIVSHPNFLWWYISMYCFIFHVFYQMKLYKNYVWIRYQIKWYMR